MRMLLGTLLEQLREFDTALLANTIGFIDSTPAHEYYMAGSIQSVTPTLEPTVGVAFTCELDSSTPADGSEDEYAEMYGGFYRQLDAMRSAGATAVWVVKAAGSRPEHECVLGDGMAKLLYAAGCAGVVTDGGVRDTKGLLTVPFAAYARGRTVHHCAYRFRSFDQPVRVGGIWIRPGDVIHANSEGVIKIPATCLESLSEAAVRMRGFEQDAHCAFRRTDLTAFQKRDLVTELLLKYGFATARADAKK